MKAEIVRQIPPPPPPATVTITMSLKEAEKLRYVAAQQLVFREGIERSPAYITGVAGPMIATLQDVYIALREAGVDIATQYQFVR